MLRSGVIIQANFCWSNRSIRNTIVCGYSIVGSIAKPNASPNTWVSPISGCPSFTNIFGIVFAISCCPYIPSAIIPGIRNTIDVIAKANKKYIAPCQNPAARIINPKAYKSYFFTFVIRAL